MPTTAHAPLVGVEKEHYAADHIDRRDVHIFTIPNRNLGTVSLKEFQMLISQYDIPQSGVSKFLKIFGGIRIQHVTYCPCGTAVELIGVLIQVAVGDRREFEIALGTVTIYQSRNRTGPTRKKSFKIQGLRATLHERNHL